MLAGYGAISACQEIEGSVSLTKNSLMRTIEESIENSYVKLTNAVFSQVAGVSMTYGPTPLFENLFLLIITMRVSRLNFRS